MISVDTEARRLQVRSDSDSGGDGKGVMASQLNGVVSFKVPFLGYAGTWLASLENDALAVMLLAFLSMVSVVLYAIETGREDRTREPSEVDIEEDFGGYEPKHSVSSGPADSGRRSMEG